MLAMWHWPLVEFICINSMISCFFIIKPKNDTRRKNNFFYRKIPDIYCRNVTNSSALVLTRTMHANIDK